MCSREVLKQYACHLISDGGTKVLAGGVDETHMERQIKSTLLICCIALGGCATISVKDPSAVVQKKPQLTIKEMLPFRFCNLPCRDVVAKPTDSPGSNGTPVAYRSISDVIAVGYASIAAQPSNDPAQQRLMAARASKLDAYRNLYEQVFGVSIGSNSTMDDRSIRKESVRTNISGTLRGVEVVSIEPLGTDTYQTTLRLPADTVIANR